MKLELKHLSAYLPYKLIVCNEMQLAEFGICTNTKEELMGLGYGNVLTDMDEFGIEYCKPILRPLSDLTKRDAREHNYPDEGHLERSLLKGHASYEVWIEYVKEHFDVFGLIEKGLAIDINTLNQ
jgi:hypothetical protein